MTIAKKISILLVDDHAIVREGYRSLLTKQPGLMLVGEAADGHHAYEQFKTHAPNITIMDISLPGTSGLDTIVRIRRREPAAKILVFSMHQNPQVAVQAINAGALGYVSKSSEPEVLLRAIQEIAGGRPFLSPDIAQALALEKLGGERLAFELLTLREFEIFRLLVDGRNHEQIAAYLHLSPKTVANTHYQIKSKLGAESDIELIRLALKLDLLEALSLPKRADDSA